MHSQSLIFALGFLASAGSVLGHSTWQDLWIGDVDEATNFTRIPPSNSPVTDVTSTDMRCNVNGATGISAVGEVAAGQNVTVEMHAQPNDRSCANEALGGNHWGPILVYMSKVADATTDVGDGSWFKVSEQGYDTTTKTWAVQTLNANCGHYSFIVPSSLASGNYLIRAEAIALHAASSVGGAQFYMSCYQINLSGTGTASPAGVAFPGAYSAQDPGILINIYQDITNYTIPGPAVFTAGTTSGASGSETTATEAPAVITTSAASSAAQPQATIESSSIVTSVVTSRDVSVQPTTLRTVVKTSAAATSTLSLAAVTTQAVVDVEEKC